MKSKNLIPVLGIFLLQMNLLSATVIVFKDGDVITGRIISEKDGKMSFESPYGKITVKKKNIKKLIANENELKTEQIQVAGKQVTLRQIDENLKQKVYIDPKGKVIKVDKSTPKKENSSKAGGPLNLFILKAGVNFVSLPELIITNTNGVGLLGFTEGSRVAKSIQLAYLRTWLPWLRAGVGAQYWYYSKNGNISNGTLTLGVDQDFSSISGMIASEIAVSKLLGISFLDFGIKAGAGLHQTSASITITSTSDTSFSVTNASMTGKSLGIFSEAGLYFRYWIISNLAFTVSGTYQYYFTEHVFSAKGPGAQVQSQNLVNEMARLSSTSISVPNGVSIKAGVAYRL